MSVAQRYATALFQAAGGRSDRPGADAAAIAAELDAAVGLLEDEADLRAFLENPGLSGDAKRQVLREVFTARMGRLTLNFLQLLLDKRRIGFLAGIARAYRAQVEASLGEARAEVQSARPLTAAETAAIGRALERRTGKTIRLTSDVRPELIGGVRVVMGDTVLDGTVRSQLERLSRTLAGRN